MPRKKKEVEALDPELYTKSGRLRKRKQKKSREYFSQDTEDAIIKYLKSDDPIEKNKLFNEHINYSLYKLVENIIHTFKFHYTDMDSVEDLKHEVVVFLLEKFHRYDQSLGKAYSFFGTIAKRYLIVYNRNNYKKLKSKAAVEEVDDDKKVFTTILNEEEASEMIKFMDSYIAYVEHNLEELFSNVSDQSIALAILEIFKRRETLDVFNKQQFYFYIREITEQKTPAITKVMKELKKVYKKLMNEMYVRGEIETDKWDIY